MKRLGTIVVKFLKTLRGKDMKKRTFQRDGQKYKRKKYIYRNFEKHLKAVETENQVVSSVNLSIKEL